MARKPEGPGGKPPVGRAAFEAHLKSLSTRIHVGDDRPETREIAAAISRARQWVDAGDYLAAVHAVGALEVQLHAGPEGPVSRVTAGDAEQALGDLRREIKSVGERKGAVEAARLWEAAREEVIGGAWEAALALINEARGWLKTG